MKKLFRNILCTAALAFMMVSGAAAAEPAELSIRFNSQPLTFTDAVPQIVSDRTYLPFRAVFTALGFADEDITFAGDTRTVAAVRDGLEVSMVIGENQVTVVENGRKRVLATDVPAFIDPAVSRTYVPVSFVAQAMGYRVAWDGSTRTVFIDDVDGILAANQETYLILDNYLEYSQTFHKKNYVLDGSFSYRIDGLMESTVMDGTYSSLTAGNTLYDAEVKMKVNGTDAQGNVSKKITLDVRGNRFTGETYYQSDALMSDAASGQKNLWVKSQKNNLNMGFGMTYIDMVRLPAKTIEAMNGKAMVEAQVRAAVEKDPTASAADYLKLYNAMLGDSSFAKDQKDYVNGVKVGTVDMTARFHTSGNKVTGYTVTMKSESGIMSMAMEISLKGSRLTALYDIGDGITSTHLELDGTYTTSQKTPAGVPDAGAVIVSEP